MIESTLGRGRAVASISRMAPQISSTARAVRRQAFNRERLVLAAKTAVAAAVAWYFAPWVPFADADYSYYAPLGVLVSMYPTLADSARASVQALLGLALGIGAGLLGLLLTASNVPDVAALAVVVGISVAVGGVRALGAGRDWIAIAALFVLLLGAADPDGFSLSYLLTVAFGAAIGLVTNLLVFPPLYLRQASRRLNELRDAAGASLSHVADRLTAGPGTQHPDPGLLELLEAVAADVREAERSRRGNPLSWRRRGQPENVRRLRALDDTVRSTIQLATQTNRMTALPDARARLGEIVAAVAAVVAAPIGSPESPGALTAAERALEGFIEERGLPSTEAGIATMHAVAALDRVIEVSRPFAQHRTVGSDEG